MKNRAPYFVICLLILLGSCVNEQQEQHIPDAETAEEEVAFSFPTIIDTSDFPTSKREASWITIANYELLYIGPRSKNITPNYQLKHGPRFYPKANDPLTDYLACLRADFYYVDWLSQDTFNYWSPDKTVITVDTTQRIKNDDIHVDGAGPYFEAYPVLIENLDTDTVTISYGEHLFLLTEALDSTRTWRPIERTWVYFCGVGVGTTILPPNEIGLTATMIYHGDYPTTLRLRMGKTYSNEFKGKINYRQFESPFEEGEYKEAYLQEMEQN